ncbi:MAG: hypothetical protein JKY26_06525 [Pseudomonas sp.]|nr:hypothetical protein [Pseudomonas sp.]
MQSPIPESRAAEAAEISQAVAEFERNGGKIERVPILIGQTYDTWRAYAPSEASPPPVAKPKTRKEQAKRGYSIREAVAASRQKHQAERDALAPEIKRMSDAGMTTMDIARQLRVSHVTVRRVAGNRAHKIKLNDRSGRQPSMTADQVRECRADYLAGKSYQQMADKYGVSRSCIRDLVTGKTRSDVI